MTQLPIRRALVSVYDKAGLDDLVRGLHEAGVALVSTGGSAARIKSLEIPVTRVEDLTGFPECLDGRVKTLHPKVHAGILADRRLDSHVQQLAELGIDPFDLVVSNLYPFRQTVASGASPDECVEQIDIGGPSMVRAAAKNHPSVAIVTSPGRYDEVLAAVAAGGFTLEQRRRLAAEAFEGPVDSGHGVRVRCVPVFVRWAQNVLCWLESRPWPLGQQPTRAAPAAGRAWSDSGLAVPSRGDGRDDADRRGAPPGDRDPARLGP